MRDEECRQAENRCAEMFYSPNTRSRLVRHVVGSPVGTEGAPSISAGPKVRHRNVMGSGAAYIQHRACGCDDIESDSPQGAMRRALLAHSFLGRLLICACHCMASDFRNKSPIHI